MHGYVQAASAGFELGSKSGMPLNIYTGNQQRLTILDNGMLAWHKHPNLSFQHELSLNSSGANVPLAYLKNTGTGGGFTAVWTIRLPVRKVFSRLPLPAIQLDTMLLLVKQMVMAMGWAVEAKRIRRNWYFTKRRRVVGYSSGSGSAAYWVRPFPSR